LWYQHKILMIKVMWVLFLRYKKKRKTQNVFFFNEKILKWLKRVFNIISFNSFCFVHLCI
jgi:hypothetical protein